VRYKNLVIGIGNVYRGDDGIGIITARKIRDLHPSETEVKEESGEGASLLEALKDARNVILVDASVSSDSPGTIHRFDASRRPIPSRFFHYSTHAFSIAEAIELARTLNQLPPRLIVYAIEGKDFSPGTEVSPEVLKASDKAVPRIIQDIIA